MGTNKQVLLAVAFFAAILAMALLWGGDKSAQATTNRKQYLRPDNLEVTIKNGSREEICFSACYPYYLEKQAEDWKQYDYGACKKKDLAISCIPGMGLKRFQVKINSQESGLHRLRIPVCEGCRPGQDFNSNSEFISNEFEIK